MRALQFFLRVSNGFFFLMSLASALWSSVGNPWSMFSDSMITPTEWTFYIWFLIYGLVFLFACCQFFLEGESIFQMGLWFTLSCLMQTFLNVTTQAKFEWLSAAVALTHLACLLILNFQIRKLNQILRFPITLWTGWMTVTTVISFCVAINNLEPTSHTKDFLLSVVSAAMLGVIATLYQQFSSSAFEYGFPLAIIWGLIGVIFNQRDKILIGICIEAIIAISITTLIVSIITCVFPAEENEQKNSSASPKKEVEKKEVQEITIPNPAEEYYVRENTSLIVPLPNGAFQQVYPIQIQPPSYSYFIATGANAV